MPAVSRAKWAFGATARVAPAATGWPSETGIWSDGAHHPGGEIRKANMPLHTILIVGGGWVALLVIALWRYRTWKDGGDES